MVGACAGPVKACIDGGRDEADRALIVDLGSLKGSGGSDPPLLYSLAMAKRALTLHIDILINASDPQKQCYESHSTN